MPWNAQDNRTEKLLSNHHNNFSQSAACDALLAMPFCINNSFCIIPKLGLDF